MNKKLVTGIIILNYNNFEDTINCIESAEKINTAPVKYIIVDNGSTREDVAARMDEYLSMKFAGNYIKLGDNDAAPEPLPRCTFYVSKNNSGYASGNKKGLKLAYHDDTINSVMILNNDVLFVDDFINVVNAHLWSREECILATPLILKKDGRTVDRTCARKKKSFGYLLLWLYFSSYDPYGIIKRKRTKQYLIENDADRYKTDLTIDMPSGSCFIAKKNEFCSIDDFDARTFLYFEEDILSEKISMAGKKCLLIPSVHCIHLGAGTTKKVQSSFLYQANLKSINIYINNYLNLNMKEKVSYNIVKFLSKIRFTIVSTLLSLKTKMR